MSERGERGAERPSERGTMSEPLVLLSLEVRTDVDVVTARQIAREVAVRLGCERRSQTRLAVATSEIVRGAYLQGRGARVTYRLAADPVPALVVEVAAPASAVSPELAE